MSKKFLFLIISFIGILFLVFWLIRPYKKGDTIVAPYYEKQVFQKPPDIPEGTPSAQVNIRLPIIMYHYVENVADPGDLIRKRLNITPFAFERQIQTMQKEGFETYFVRDVPDFLQQKIVHPHPIILTFDDGYEDFYTVAFPILKKYHMKATLYIMYNYIGRKGYLTSREISEIIESKLVEIGSHTLNHAYLKHVSSSILEHEIVDNKRKLEERFGISIETFAYPYGAFDTPALSNLQKAGYTGAVSVIPGIVQSEQNLFYLSRIRAGALTGKSVTKVLEGIKK